MKRCLSIIAEFGSNPASTWDLTEFCRMAANSGATHCKIQLFKHSHFPRAEWDAKLPLEFPRDELETFVRSAHSHGLRAGASVFDRDAVQLASRHLDFIKVAAREQDNQPLHAQVISALLTKATPLYYSVTDAAHRPVGWRMLSTPLFTISQYPTPMARACYHALRMPYYMRDVPGWGWSSHTRGALDCWLAVLLGASVIEKHFATSTIQVEAGHSLLPTEFRRMTELLRGGR